MDVQDQRSEPADNSCRQGSQYCLARRRHPTLVSVAGHLGREPQVTHQDVLTPFEARARRHRRSLEHALDGDRLGIAFDARRGFGRRVPWSAVPGCVACSMPDGRDGGCGGRPFSRATSSRNAWFSVRSAVTVACCASAPLRSDPTSVTRALTRSRNSATEKVSSDAASGNDMQAVNHAATLGATTSPGNLPQLRC